MFVGYHYLMAKEKNTAYTNRKFALFWWLPHFDVLIFMSLVRKALKPVHISWIRINNFHMKARKQGSTQVKNVNDY